MFIDTHCHINLLVKQEFEKELSHEEIQLASKVIFDAEKKNVSTLINVGTSLIESMNCIALAQTYTPAYATIGIHPNDCSKEWKNELITLTKLLSNPKNKIVGIGETGLDFYRPGYDKQRQIDAFHAHIELALKYNLGLVIHSRAATEELFRCLERYRTEPLRAVLHCFSETLDYAQQARAWNLYLGIGGTITYPKNESLRSIIQTLGIDGIVLETDTPFLPPQHMRGKQNHPQEISTIAHFIAELLAINVDIIAQKTTSNAQNLFTLL